MLTIDTYTGNWQQALRPSAPRVGSHFHMPESPDAREYDDFRRVLTRAGLYYEFVRYLPRLKMDVCRVIRADD